MRLSKYDAEFRTGHVMRDKIQSKLLKWVKNRE